MIFIKVEIHRASLFRSFESYAISAMTKRGIKLIAFTWILSSALFVGMLIPTILHTGSKAGVFVGSALSVVVGISMLAIGYVYSLVYLKSAPQWLRGLLASFLALVAPIASAVGILNPTLVQQSEWIGGYLVVGVILLITSLFLPAIATEKCADSPA